MSSNEEGYYNLNIGALPTELKQADVPNEKWLKHCVYSSTPFPANSMSQLPPLDFYPVQLERVVGFTLYFALNFIPLTIPVLLFAYVILQLKWVLTVAVGLFCYSFGLFILWKFISYLNGWNYSMSDHLSKSDKSCSQDHVSKQSLRRQFGFTYGNTEKYVGTEWVWPASLHPGNNSTNPNSPNNPDDNKMSSDSDPNSPSSPNKPNERVPTVFCMVPHSVLPLGCLSYGSFSKLFSPYPKVVHWTAAPVLFNLPIIGKALPGLGMVPARAKDISRVLREDKEDIGVVLDGIAGMFQPKTGLRERAYVLSRKGIISIALKAGNVRIVPVYAFGHTAMWIPLNDPFGLLERLSVYINVSLVTFLGRFGIPYGAPMRKKLLLAFGDPIYCPANPNQVKPSQEKLDLYHGRLVRGFKDTFDTHKTAYGWGDRTLELV